MRLFLFIILLVLIGTTACAQVPVVPRAPSPKRELRAVWIATVVNIDYPSKPTERVIAQQEEFKNLLDQYRGLGFNAVIVQIRCAGDSFYESAYAPWSRYLTGQEGRAPEPYYDPLTFMVAEAHKRGMEFHAWLNPFRAAMNLDSTLMSPRHAFFQHRDWLVSYGNRFYFNPGLPVVQQHIADVVGEVVDNYDIDAIHFDDYFYPYPVAGQGFPDTVAFMQYGSSYPDIGDWRRANVNQVIQNVRSRIKESKPYVLFGISPFGVWRNKDKDPRGSDTRASATSYDDLYADVLHWIDNRWIDYVMPQLYWHIGYAPADFAGLLQWWSQHKRGVDMYVGQAAYKVGDNKELPWHVATEIPNQIDMIRRNFASTGSAFFSARSILANPLQLKDSVRAIYSQPALLPERTELAAAEVRMPEMKKLRYLRNEVQLRWKNNLLDVLNRPSYFVIYRFEGDEPRNIEDPSNILHVTPFQLNCDKYYYNDAATLPNVRYTYAVVAMNRAHTESKPIYSETILRTERGMKMWQPDTANARLAKEPPNKSRLNRRG